MSNLIVTSDEVRRVSKILAVFIELLDFEIRNPFTLNRKSAGLSPS